MNEFFLLMQQELLLTAIIFILLFAKLGAKDLEIKTLLLLTNILLTINLVAGFFFTDSGSLFGDMFRKPKGKRWSN